ncbi:MAG: hypothetical protein ACFB4I_22475 [Cyanophyceae cyanobacterium]
MNKLLAAGAAISFFASPAAAFNKQHAEREIKSGELLVSLIDSAGWSKDKLDKMSNLPPFGKQLVLSKR